MAKRPLPPILLGLRGREQGQAPGKRGQAAWASFCQTNAPCFSGWSLAAFSRWARSRSAVLCPSRGLHSLGSEWETEGQHLRLEPEWGWKQATFLCEGLLVHSCISRKVLGT